MNKIIFKKGFIGTYINDYWREEGGSAKQILEMPESVAIEWLRTKLGNEFSIAGTKTCDMKSGRYFHNKYFVIFDLHESYPKDQWMAIYNHDGMFYLYYLTDPKE